MTEETDDYTISDYVSQHFGMLIGEKMTFLTCNEKTPQSIKIQPIYFSIGRNYTQKEKIEIR